MNLLSILYYYYSRGYSMNKTNKIPVLMVLMY